MRTRTARAQRVLLLLTLLASPSLAAEKDRPAATLVRRLDYIEKQLERIEERLVSDRREWSPDARASEVEGVIATWLETLRRDLLAELRERSAGRCSVHQATLGGRREVVVLVAGTWLRFLEVVPPEGPVTIGLDEDLASALYRQAQEQIAEALLPTIYRAVPAIDRTVAPFLLQDRLVAPELRLRLGSGGSSERVSLRQAEAMIETLNKLCAGSVRFDLPTEEQLLVAARVIYDPRHDLLRPCHEVAHLAGNRGISDLLGAGWQLTRSPCRPFGGATADACPEGTYVIKGGTARSTNALECIPEYRDAVPPTVAAQDTALRLVIAP